MLPWMPGFGRTTATASTGAHASSSSRTSGTLPCSEASYNGVARAPLEQHHGHILVPVLNGHEQWRSAVREALIRAASRKQEEASDVGVAVLAGDIQKIGLRSSVAQILCHEPSEHRKVSALDSEREGRLGLALG